MNSTMKPAAFVLAVSGLMAAAAMSVAGGGGGVTPAAQTGLDLSVSCVAASTSGTISISVDATGAATGMFGIALGTTSCNVGSVYVPFQAAMQYNHPYIVQNIYRTNAQGRLEQLSASWIKHAFSSASTSQAAVNGPNGQPACGTGSCDGIGGSRMGFNCSDTYGPGLNSSTYYLGPRNEVKPNDVGFTSGGTPPAGRTWLGWNPRGSMFDNYVWNSTLRQDVPATTGLSDSARSYTTGSTGTPFKINYLRDDEITTGASGALGTDGRLFFESYYVVNGDVSRMNNHAHRRFRVTGNRQFAMDGPHTFGPTIMQWGDQQQLATPDAEGAVIVASRVVPLPDGNYRYEYNVYNMDFDREVSAVDFPSLPIGTRTDVGFRQPRQVRPTVNPPAAGQLPTAANLLGNDTAGWVGSYDDGKDAMVFQAPAVPRDAGTGVPTTSNLNTISWGTMYTFWYTSNLPPRTTGMATLYPSPDRISNDPRGTVNPTPSTILTMQARVSVPRNPADITNVGGQGFPDGIVSGDDFNAFISAYAAEDARADIAGIGGALQPDGMISGDDFVAFINWFVQQ
ncbi:MAG: hypothetical protein LW650_10240 [Planctomycetaceae bacterium]|nr:hypothetical protein [Phycisphaerales bacterium]MCE2653834.1 hypothetical protein [Planctomycetaceae bacterium]